MGQRLLRLGDEGGQSLIEFLFLLPLFGVVTAMVWKSTTAIQMSIVNQKYARMQALYSAYSNPNYPEARVWKEFYGDLQREFQVFGVGEKESPDSGQTAAPIAPKFRITTDRAAPPANLGQEYSKTTSQARVRASVLLCGPPFSSYQSSGEVLATADLGELPYCRGFSGVTGL
jgi:hypothetical protein